MIPTHEEAVEIGSKLLWFLDTSLKMAPQYVDFLPGATTPIFAPQIYRTVIQPPVQAKKSAGTDGHPINSDMPAVPGILSAGGLTSRTTEQAMARGILFARSPATVDQQIMDSTQLAADLAISR